MNLCLRCGKIGDHAKGCPAAPEGYFDTAPPAKNARALKALEEVQAGIKEAKPLADTNPREAAKKVFALEKLLENHPSSDLTSFEQKRNWKAAEDALKGVRTAVAAKLGDKPAEQIFEDLTFARKALELLFQQQKNRREVGALSLDELTRIEGLGFNPADNPDATDPGSLARHACEVIERRLATTSTVDSEVDALGKSYLEPLATGETPRELPSTIVGDSKVPLLLLGSGVAILVAGIALAVAVGQKPAGGALAAIGALDLIAGAVLFAKASAKKSGAPVQFAALSKQFRDRLYLVSVLRSLRGVVSNLSKAEEALRTQVSGENGARWKRIKTQEKDLVKALCGDWDEKHTVDDEMLRRIATAGEVPEESILPAASIGREDWDGLAKAYQAERREDSEASDETRLAVLSQIVLAHAGQKPEAQALRKRAIAEARNAFTGRATSRMSKDLV
jgi:hypothetical protein